MFNNESLDNFRNMLVLAPLSKGSNLPFRRLAADWGADITVSEMVYARSLLKENRRDLVLLRKADNEQRFGIQLITSQPEEAGKAAKILNSHNIAFVDLNAGCPIHDAVRRGAGAFLLKKPAKIVKILHELTSHSEHPITVKLRSGWNNNRILFPEFTSEIAATGISGITLHARTREQRYTGAADWELIKKLVERSEVPVIGNGDILTWYEARDRKELSGAASLMLGRGALIKPWIFTEIKEQRELSLSAKERVAIYYQLTSYMKEHFGDDEKGKKKAMYFLPWHFSFFHRYQPLPEEDWAEKAKEHPLLQTRLNGNQSEEPLDILLKNSSKEIHKQIAEAIWDGGDEGEAVLNLEKLAAGDLCHNPDT